MTLIMLSICNICLRSDRKLRSIHENLETFYDELCEYGHGFNPKFCSECISKLNKCYEFKKSCRHAIDVFKKWKRQSKRVRQPLNLLYTEIPTPQLCVCNQNNIKVSADLEITPKDSRQPNMINIPRSDDIAVPSSVVENVDEKFTESTLLFKQETDNNEVMEFSDNDNHESEIINFSTIKVEHDSNTKPSKESEELGSDDDLTESDDEVMNNQEEILSDSDESLKELLAKIKKPKTLLEMTNIDINVKCKKRRYKKKTVNVEALKTYLKEKFERYGDIKDDKGNVINKDTVINNLDKVYFLHKLSTLCSGPGPFNALAIRKLSEIHSRFVYDSMFDIVVLKNEEQMRAEFEKRRLITDPSRPYRCEICLVSFKYRSSLDSHNKRNHNEAYAFECPICHVRLRKRTMIYSHNNFNHKISYKCKLCTNFTTCGKSSMIDHYNMHRGVKRTCEYCGKIFSKSGLALHINTAHEPQHICELCACAFMKPHGLLMHRSLKHFDEKFIESEFNKKCEECNVTFITEDVYHKHMRITHHVRKLKTAGRKHQKKKSREQRTFNCRLCDWKGPTRVTQMEHYQFEHPNEDIQRTWEHLCHECGKRFKHLHEYRRHMNKHTGTRLYACKSCPKKFFGSNALHVHAQRHLPPSLECPYCSKKFTTSTGLCSHKRIHINDRRFKCHICDKGFLTRGNLKQHIAGVHHNMKRVRKPRQQNMDIE